MPPGGAQDRARRARVARRSGSPCRAAHPDACEQGGEMTDQPRKRIHVHTIPVAVQVLETRLDVAEAQGLGPDQRAAAEGVRRLLRRADDAAYGVDPKSGPFSRWW